MRFNISRMQMYCYELTRPQNFQPDMNMTFGLRFNPGMSADDPVARFVAELGRQGALRVRFSVDHGTISQDFAPENEIDVIEEAIATSASDPAWPKPVSPSSQAVLWYRQLGYDESFAEEMLAIARREKSTVIDLVKDSPVRVLRCNDPKGGAFLFVTFNHAVADVSSFVEFLRAFRRRDPAAPRNAAVDLRFLERVEEHHRKSLTHGEQQKAFWMGNLGKVRDETDDSLLDWPAVSCESVHHEIEVDQDLEGSRFGRTVQAMLLACFLFSWEWTGNKRRAYVLSTIDNRRGRDDAGIFGCFFRHVIWTNPLDQGIRDFGDVVKNIARQAIRAYANVDVSLSDIIREYRQLHDAAPRLDLSFTYRNMTVLDEAEDDDVVQLIPLQETVLDERLPLQFHVSRLAGRLDVHAVFNPAVFDEADIRTMCRKFESYLLSALDGQQCGDRVTA